MNVFLRVLLGGKWYVNASRFEEKDFKFFEDAGYKQCEKFPHLLEKTHYDERGETCVNVDKIVEIYESTEDVVTDDYHIQDVCTVIVLDQPERKQGDFTQYRELKTYEPYQQLIKRLEIICKRKETVGMFSIEPATESIMRGMNEPESAK